jgi:DNA-binding transcriptional LysR family regulator
VATGEADIAIGVFRQRPENTFHQPVMQDSLLVASRREHPRIGAILDLETYCALGHLLVGHAPDERGMVDTALDGLGRERRVLALVPQLSLALALASQSDAVVTAPSSACRQAAALFPLTLHRPPLDLPSLEVGLLRHRDGRSDAALNWFGDQIVGALSTAATEGARIG